MSLLNVVPEAVTSAAGQLESIGSALVAANAQAALPTTGIAAMAADEVSAGLHSLFTAYAQGYQAVSAQAAAFHSAFVSLLSGGAGQYLSTELANVQESLASAVGGTGGLVPASFSFGAPTPFGQVELTGDGSVFNGVPNVTGSFTAPAALAYALDAAGAPLSAGNAFGNSIAAAGNAARTGNPTGFLIALLNTPGNTLNGFLFGQGSITQPIPVPAGLPFTSAEINIPYGGLLAPLQPVSATVTGPRLVPTVVSLGGTQLGGLLPAVQDGLLLPAVRGLLLPAV